MHHVESITELRLALLQLLPFAEAQAEQLEEFYEEFPEAVALGARAHEVLAFARGTLGMTTA